MNNSGTKSKHNQYTKEQCVEGVLDLDPGSHYRLRAGRHVGEAEKYPGASYIFEFPFDIYVEDFFKGGIIFKRGHGTLRISAPFGREKSEFIVVESVPPDVVPLEKNSTLGWELKSTKFTIEGLGFRASLLRVDSIPDLGDDEVTGIVEQFLGNVRFITGQWWIGKDRRPFSSLICNQFGINAVWERTGTAQVYSSAYGLWGFERPLTEAHLQSLSHRMNRDATIPVSHDLFFQGVHAHASYDTRASIIDLAIAAEAGIAEKLQRYGRECGLTSSAIKQALSRKFLQRLDVAACDVMGRSFRREYEAEYKWIETLWKARGNLAHGKSARARLPDGTIAVLDVGHIAQIIPAVSRLLWWPAD